MFDTMLGFVPKILYNKDYALVNYSTDLALFVITAKTCFIVHSCGQQPANLQEYIMYKQYCVGDNDLRNIAAKGDHFHVESVNLTTIMEQKGK